MRRSLSLQLVLLLGAIAPLSFGQVGNGTITGTVTDPANAIVPAAAVVATNTQTGVAYSAVSTSTGSYTITDLPVGTYSVTAKVQGFKTYIHTNLAIAATQVIREDIRLEVGNATTETITISAEASLLKTESGDVSHNISIDQLDDLPLLGIGTANSGTSGVRNPYNTLQTLPGVSSYASSGQFTLNGLGGAMTETMRVEGQDATSRIFGTYDYTQMGQPSADSIQEIAYQTSNYAAEYGQAGSAVINMTMKSGTNQYHGTGYDYFVNEFLNAGNPFSSNCSERLESSGRRNRRNDFGGTLGRTGNNPQNLQRQEQDLLLLQLRTVPRNYALRLHRYRPYGGLSGTATSLPSHPTALADSAPPTASRRPRCTTDAARQARIRQRDLQPHHAQGTTSSGLGYANPFNEQYDSAEHVRSRFLKVLRLVPSAENSNLVGNYGANIQGGRYSAIPSIKIDQNISSKDKLSFFWSRINTESQISAPLGNADGLPIEIGQYRGTFIPTYTTRLNYDRTLTPRCSCTSALVTITRGFTDKAPYTTFDPASIRTQRLPDPPPVPQLHGIVLDLVRLSASVRLAVCRISGLLVRYKR